MDLVEYLLGLGVFDVNATNRLGVTPLGAACGKGHLGVASVLIEAGADVGGGKASQRPLIRACSGGNPELVAFLVEAGGEVGPMGMKAAVEKGHVDVVEMLLGMGVGVEGDGDTLLCVAARGGHVGVVRLLMGVEGVDVNQAGARGQTPLILASRKGYEDLVRVLVEGGANVGKATPKGTTPLALARKYGHDGVVEVLERAG